MPTLRVGPTLGKAARFPQNIFDGRAHLVRADRRADLPNARPQTGKRDAVNDLTHALAFPVPRAKGAGFDQQQRRAPPNTG